MPLHLSQFHLAYLRFYWKIIHDPINAVGVAVVGVNNIHLKVSLDSILIHLKT